MARLQPRYARSMRWKAFVAVASLMWGTAGVVHAQHWLAVYQRRAAAMQVNQPHWATPLNTISPRVEQGLRSDFVRQTGTDGQRTWNYGGTKGLQVLPLPRTEFQVSAPPFFAHSDPKVQDGFGDVALRLKYRLYGSNEAHHNALVTGLLQASLPTGKQKNGSCCVLLTPTLELGKGLGPVVVTVSAGGVLPASDAAGLGRSIALNQAVQWHAVPLVWLETEFNTTLYAGGKNDGKKQTFTTVGVVVSRIPLGHYAMERYPLVLSLGVGEQIALTHFHTYDHAPVLSVRLRF